MSRIPKSRFKWLEGESDMTMEDIDKEIKEAEENIRVLSGKTRLSANVRNSSIRYWNRKLDLLLIRKKMMEEIR